MTRLSSVLLVSACLALPINAHALDVSVGGVSASVGGNGSGGLGVGASVGGSGGINAGASVGGRSGGGLGADVNASVGGSRGVNANTSATVGGRSIANANVNASVGGSRGLNASANTTIGGAKALDVDLGWCRHRSWKTEPWNRQSRHQPVTAGQRHDPCLQRYVAHGAASPGEALRRYHEGRL